MRNVVNDSNKLSYFVDNQVPRDYNIFMTTNNQYANDVDRVRSIVTGVNDIADKISVSAQKVSDVLKQVQDYEISAEQLDTLVDFFQL